MSPEQENKNPRKFSRADFMRLAGGGALGAGAAMIIGPARRAEAQKGPAKTKVDPPVLTCGTATQASIDIQVCAGATGLPAGFSIQWMSAADYAANGNQWYLSDDPRLCKASFSGNASGSRYNLLAGECVTVNIGEILFDNGASTNCDGALVCGTAYVFRAFGHATSSLTRSDFTANLTCSTLECNDDCASGNCTLTQGYWKTHGPAGCVTGNNTNTWPTTSLMLGSVSYTDLQLCSILNKPAAGNGLIALAHQLIAAKLNVAKGANGTDAASAIAAADALIGTLVVPPVGTGYLHPSLTGALTTTLAQYNEGLTGPGHCDC
jgi:hypothetical protein